MKLHLFHSWGKWESVSWTIVLQYRVCSECRKKKLKYL